MARPTKYERKFNKQVERLAILGATEKEIADFFDIDPATLTRWKRQYPEFCTSLKRGRLPADAKVAESLFKRATGYSHKAVKIFNNEGAALIVPYIEKYPPDVVAAIFWLKNRRGKIDPAEGLPWKDRQEMGLQFGDMTDDEIESMVQRLAEKVKTSNNPKSETDGQE